jgi:hypothetical protein
MPVDHSHHIEDPNATTPPPQFEVVGNNLADAQTRFVVTMFSVPGQPMLIPVSAEEFEERRSRREVSGLWAVGIRAARRCLGAVSLTGWSRGGGAARAGANVPAMRLGATRCDDV